MGAVPPGSGQPGPGAGGVPPGYGQPGLGAGAVPPGYGQPSHGHYIPGQTIPGQTVPGLVIGGQAFPGQEGPTGRKRRSRGLLSHALTAAVAAAVAVGLTLTFYQSGTSSNAALQLPGSDAVPAPGHNSRPSTTSTANSQATVTKVERGLVIINTRLTYSAEAAAGTGMVINRDGLILTNNHVIRGATQISATVAVTGKTYPARVIGYDKTQDVALIQLQKAPALNTVPIGNSTTVQTHDPVLALGNAQGQGGITFAGGRITGLNKTVTASDAGAGVSETLHGMLMTNAHIQPGDSGGPLVGAGGGVIGMDTAGNSVSLGSTAPEQGFAIPINYALSLARQIAGGHASPTITVGYPPFVGVFIASGQSSNPRSQAGGQQSGGQGNPFPGFPGFPGFGGSGNTGTGTPSTPQCSASQATLNMPSKIAPVNRGTLVEGTICGSPADKAGLTGGSVITAVNGQPVGAPRTLGAALAKFHPGDSVALTWVSPSGKQDTSTVRLEAGPPQ
ncbi:MAG TPA: trypsin-like peptidase domain-containing protein [Streptosporangiaceae bacterium]|nr:trypsin-like peptidase domain-containing protein [Streptosporangiaceae bacterium]